MARFCTLASGSSGNAAYVGSSGSAVLVDLGISCKAAVTALKELNLEESHLEGILITHEHIDHIRGLKVFLKSRRLPVYASAEVLDYLASHDYLSAHTSAEEIKPGKTQIGSLQVECFDTSHDSVHSLGYRITMPDERRVTVATDLGVLDTQVRYYLLKSDLVLLESNYDTRMLETGSYPYHLKRRISGKNGHLSNDDCAAQLPELIHNGTTRIVLAHLSKENNLPALAYQTALSELTLEGMEEGKDFQLSVAPRYSPSPLTVF